MKVKLTWLQALNRLKCGKGNIIIDNFYKSTNSSSFWFLSKRTGRLMFVVDRYTCLVSANGANTRGDYGVITEKLPTNIS